MNMLKPATLCFRASCTTDCFRFEKIRDRAALLHVTVKNWDSSDFILKEALSYITAFVAKKLYDFF